MNWKYKALLHKIFSLLPLGSGVHYLFQRHITHSLPPPAEKCEQGVRSALWHVNAFRRHGRCEVCRAYFYEFGAGRDMLIPLTYYALGINHQIEVDVRPLLKGELVNNTIEYLSGCSIVPFQRRPATLVAKANARRDLKSYYGIEYRAPCDAASAGIESRSVDCITSTNTLEHIPLPALKAILGECHRILSDEGIMSMQIDYQDHFSYFDGGINGFNFLRYSDKRWRVFNSATHYQNRLRHCDYLDLFHASGFELLEECVEEGSREDAEAIRSFPVHRKFEGYPHRELIRRTAKVVLRKAPL